MPSNVGSPVGRPALQDLSNRQFPTKNAASLPKETAASAASQIGLAGVEILSEHPPRQRILRMMALLFVMRRQRAIYPSSSLNDHMLLRSGGLINRLAPPPFYQTIQLTSCMHEDTTENRELFQRLDNDGIVVLLYCEQAILSLRIIREVIKVYHAVVVFEFC